MIKVLPWTGGTDEEYETQHFGFGAQRLQIAVRQMVEQKIRTAIKDMVSDLQESLDLNDTDKTTLAHSCDKLIQLYCARAGPSLEVIDGEIERLLKVPKFVLLPADEAQSQQVNDKEHEKLRNEVVELRKRVERGALMEALLGAEEEELASIGSVCESAKKDMEVLDLLHKNLERSNSLETIQNTTQTLCDRVPFMKNSDSFFDV